MAREAVSAGIEVKRNGVHHHRLPERLLKLQQVRELFRRLVRKAIEVHGIDHDDVRLILEGQVREVMEVKEGRPHGNGIIQRVT